MTRDSKSHDIQCHVMLTIRCNRVLAISIYGDGIDDNNSRMATVTVKVRAILNISVQYKMHDLKSP